MKQISQFLQEVDACWSPLRTGKQPLRIIGCGALMLQTDYERGTKDSDILETADLDATTSAQLLALAGKNTPIFERNRMFIDVVANGIPFLAQRPSWHLRSELSASLNHFEIHVLDVLDVIVSKLKRFHANDKADVTAMVDRDLVPHGDLVRRFEAAFDSWKDGAQGEDLPKYIANLNWIESNLLFVDESVFELPSWL